MRRLLTYIALVSLPFGSVNAQNLEKIGQEDMVTVGGGINFNTVVNQLLGGQQFRDPFAWTLSGNVNVSILDVSLPFTFSFSNAGSSYTQPFNMTALHPSYKKWKAHLGITSMSFSPYTYQGLNFAGAGVEYSPDKWKFKAFGGRLKKAIEYDASINNMNSVSYRRYGFGFSTKYEGKFLGSELILFKSYDDGTSLSFAPQNPELTVRDNVVVSLGVNAKPFQGFTIKGEIASSLLTNDVLAKDPTFVSPFYNGLVRGNQTTESNQAYNASMDYKIKFFGIGMKYERIDPEYTTLGAVYFNNDLENITVNPSFTLFKNKANLNFSTGYQRNNLDNTNATNARRWIGSMNLSAQIIKGLSLSANYSNLSSFTRRNPQADPFYNQLGDTLNYYQVSQNMSTSLSYAFGDSVKQSLSLTGSYAQSENITGRLDDAGAFGLNVTSDTASLPVDVYNGIFMHRITLSKSGTSIGWSVNGNHSIAMGSTNTFVGPGVNLSQRFKKPKMNLSTGVTYNRQYTGNILASNVLNYRMGLNYAPEFWDKKYGSVSMSLNGTMTNRFAVLGTNNTSNITIIANISYQFK